MTATEYNGISDEVKTSLLLHCTGEKAREVYNTFVFSSTEDSMKYNKVLEHSGAYFGPQKTLLTLVLNFSRINRNQAKHFDDYIPEMWKLNRDCNLLELHESLLRDMLTIGLNIKSL